nr:uncharacterized protein LOC117681987 [Crassostrea gigas]
MMNGSLQLLMTFCFVLQVEVLQGKITFFFHVDKVKSDGRLLGGACCQGVSGTHCTKLCKPVLTVCLRNRNHPCLTSFTTTLDMKRTDVVYGSKVGNITNPEFLEVDSWNKHLSTISITVVDLQTSSLPLIYQTQFSDFNLNIGYNILSQHWMEKKLTANTFSI